ncbi:MAG TPA: hypothetical protein VEB60_01760 [Candidatus Paceibacterota bacterium]|nr:hypothetical protein [Candidatus Paceibacterota bacterium]
METANIKPSVIKKAAFVMAGLIVLIGLLIIGRDIFTNVEETSITSFAECAAAGYPIMESYPEQCRTPDGRLFVNEIATSSAPTISTSTPNTAKACKPTGCSGQICADEEMASTCEFREEYACYESAVCERQANGQCGWTETAELTSCLNQTRSGN